MKDAGMARRRHRVLGGTGVDADQHGFTIVIVALTMTIMVTITAIVIDLGNTYATHRQVQNAVDAAAMAATRQLAKGATGVTILSTAQTVVGANGADSSSVVCKIIANTLTPTPFPFVTSYGDPLTCANYTNRTDYPTADGVWISASKTTSTFFGGIVNAPTLSTSAVAAATAQPLRRVDVTLFAVCGDDQQHDQNNLPNLAAPVLLDANGNPWDAATNPNPVLPMHTNSAAIYNRNADGGLGGPVYQIHGSQIDNCGATSRSNKGLIISPVSVWGGSPPTGSGAYNNQAGTGVVAGPTRSSVANQSGCDLSSSVNCVMILPICDSATGTGTNTNYRCEYFGAFQLLTATTNTDNVAFLGQAFPEASYGQGGTGTPQPNEIYIIKLVI
jgi:Flp pilus assembly protein TadG